MSNEATKTTDNSDSNFFRAATVDFKKIPGNPIAYWASYQTIEAFVTGEKLGEVVPIRSGMSTTNNTRFLRVWSEVNFNKIGLGSNSLENAKGSLKKWFPFKKGGDFRKWAGNDEYCLNWEDDGREIKDAVVNNPKDPNTTHWSRRIFGVDFFFCPGITWTRISSSSFSCRYHGKGYLFSDASNGVFPTDNVEEILSFLNSKVSLSFLSFLAPTLNYMSGDISRLPYIRLDQKLNERVVILFHSFIENSESDWDDYETSWNFSSLPLLHQDNRQSLIKATYIYLRAHWREITLEMQRLEEENNRIFIDVYGLQDELKSDVPLNEITLTCNPHYRYGNNKNEEELEVLLADTMKELISYSVGCMFGRYSLDKPGLILANQGETIKDYYKKLQEPRIDTNGHEVKNQENISVNSCSLVVQNSFEPDADNVIPMLDGDWFTDDITDRFCKFLKVTFGEEHYEDNLVFIENALGKDIRKYFLKDFYNDHMKRYKKRPIYWLFSSPKGTFNALIYMHRYRPDTVSVVLNDYLREFRTKLSARRNHLEAVSISANASQGEKTKALKEVENLRKMIDELDIYEREVLYPLATEQVEIDLDDGVKVNYQKFGEALKKIPDLAAKDEE